MKSSARVNLAANSPFLRMTAFERRIYRKAAFRSHRMVSCAVKTGKLANLKKTVIECTDCRMRRAIEYDHRDYFKPLDVEPVCRLCNVKRGPAKLIYPIPAELIRERQIDPNCVVKRDVCVCSKCRHEWLSESQALPKRCAKCKTPTWNKSMPTAQRLVCICAKCGHTWLPESPRVLPKRCAKCKTMTWNKKPERKK
jgi:hypothetical protein